MRKANKTKDESAGVRDGRWAASPVRRSIIPKHAPSSSGDPDGEWEEEIKRIWRAAEREGR